MLAIEVALGVVPVLVMLIVLSTKAVFATEVVVAGLAAEAVLNVVALLVWSCLRLILASKLLDLHRISYIQLSVTKLFHRTWITSSTQLNVRAHLESKRKTYTHVHKD